MFRFLTALAKKEPKISAIVFESEMIFSPSVSSMSSKVFVFSENRGFTVFQHFLLFAMSNGSRLPKYDF